MVTDMPVFPGLVDGATGVPHNTNHPNHQHHIPSHRQGAAGVNHGQQLVAGQKRHAEVGCVIQLFQDTWGRGVVSCAILRAAGLFLSASQRVRKVRCTCFPWCLVQACCGVLSRVWEEQSPTRAQP